MRTKKDKGPLRNFNFFKPADDSLLLRAKETGRDMVVVLEDLLLDRRQFSPIIEQFLQAESDRLGLSRQEIIEMALLTVAMKRQANGQESRN